MKHRFYILMVAVLFQSISAHAQLVVNEWMSKNSTSIADEDGDRSDWLEIYNGGSAPVNLGGYGLTDNLNDLGKWLFPATVLGPSQHLVVFCSGKDRLTAELHTNFKLSDDDEIVLTNQAGSIVHQVDVAQNTYDISEGLTIDGATSISEFYQPTPGNPNVDGIIHNRFEPSHEPGFYSDDFALTVTPSEPHTVHYTLDGSVPSSTDPILSSSIIIRNRSNEPMYLASIPTTADNLNSDIVWEAPVQTPFRGTVVRLRSFNGSQPTSHIQSGTYFVNPLAENRNSLPVASIITDSLNLFQYDTGIFVPGYFHDIDPDGGHPTWGTGNYNQAGDNWERTAHFELFSNNGERELNQNIGIRIHGTGSRAYPQKSIRLYAREKYGKSKIEEEVFPGVDKDEFDVLVLRNFGQDFVTGVAQDVLANRLIENLHQAHLEDRAVLTFVNGEYWGIQNLRERFDKHFLSDFHESDKDSIDIIDGYYGGANMGNNTAYFELYDFLENNDFSIQSNYNQVATMMDIEDFIDNTLTRIYLGCYDWPGNNMRMWRERSPEGKFRWLLLDNDKCFAIADLNSLEHATETDNPGWPNPPESTLFLRRLLMNTTFRQQFISRMVELLNTEFDRVHVASTLSAIYNQYKNEYDEHDNRWSALDSHPTLEESYQAIIDIIEVRSCYVRDDFIEFFNLSESEFDYECDLSDLTLTSGEVNDQQEVAIYPNPNNGQFDVVIPTSGSKSIEISLVDLKGAMVYSEKRHSINSTFRINVEGLPSGIYVVQVRTNNEILTEKLVIQRP